ncbi:MAG: transposase [Endozoicomonas sp.]
MPARIQNSTSLTARYLVRDVTDCLGSIPDHRPNHCQNGIPFGNFPKSAYAMFQMKMPSMLRFDQGRQDPVQAHNLETLFDITEARVPCDTYLREVLDPVSPEWFRKPYKKLFQRFQRSKRLALYEFRIGRLENHYLLAIDGTQTFFSGTLHCKECCVKNQGKPSEAYYHQLLGGCIVHPDQKVVIPLAPEAIVYQDGATKNDCEKNALKRFLAHVKKDHPYLSLIIVLDGLYADGPTIRLIKSYGWHYIIVAKDGNHAPLIEAVDELDRQEKVSRFLKTDKETGVKHWYRYVNDVPLNKSEPVEQVNVMDFVETDKKGKRHTWSWVTDIHLTEKNLEALMRGGRCRWHIENQTFNTLKHQDYHLEHNYGHGQQHLATNFAYLTVLAFLVDQLQLLGSPEFNRALKERAKGTRTHLWELMKGYFQSWLIKTWEGLFDAITNRAVAGVVPYDTS